MTQPYTPSISPIEVNQAALLMESSVTKKVIVAGGLIATQLSNKEGEFVLVQGIGEDFLLLS
jgi:hypothetical protein